MRNKHQAPTRDIRVRSQLQNDGQMLIGVARGGLTHTGEILYRIEPEKLAGACEDMKEMAAIVNNLGVLVLAQLCRFELANSLTGLPKAVAAWANIDMTKAVEDQTAEALAIAQKTVHGMHGCSCDWGDKNDPDPEIACHCACECTGTPSQLICAKWCSLCRAAQMEADDVTSQLAGEAGGGESAPVLRTHGEDVPREGHRADSTAGEVGESGGAAADGGDANQ